MYQWTDPDTGTTQLSGKPPAWYRSGKVGPRIFVFEKGQIVDDTDIVLSDEHQALMRERAYSEAEVEIARARTARLRQQEKKQAEPEDVTEPGVSDTPVTEEDDSQLAEAENYKMFEETDEPSGSKQDLTLQQMKDLIQQWEDQQEAQMKQALDQQ